MRVCGFGFRRSVFWGSQFSGSGLRLYVLSSGNLWLEVKVYGARFIIVAGIHVNPDRQSSPSYILPLNPNQTTRP